jgi:amino acid adenylation domain-containing protein
MPLRFCASWSGTPSAQRVGGVIDSMLVDWPPDRSTRIAVREIATRCTDPARKATTSAGDTVRSEDPRFDAVVRWASTSLEDVCPGDSALVVEFGHGKDVAIDFLYDPDRVDLHVLALAASHMDTLLRGAAAIPDAGLRAHAMVSDCERRQVLDWGCTSSASEPRLVHVWWDEIVARQPDAVALASSRRTLTYRELKDQADRLAGRLQSHGIGPESRVGVWVEPWAAPVAFWGVLKSGGVYVPIEAKPGPRFEQLLGRIQAAALLISADRRAALTPVTSESIPIIDVDGPPASDGGVATNARQSRVDPDHLAYILFTSGSTGAPKGAMVGHAALSHYAVGMVEALRLEPTDRVLQFAPRSFDVSLEEYLIGWLSGAAVVIPPSGAVRSVDELAGLIEHEGVSVVELPTAYWHAWVDWLDALERRVSAKLRMVIIGGEPVNPRRVDSWMRRHVSLYHVYGLTESTITSTVYAVPEHRPAGAQGLPVGRPLPYATVRVLDERLEPAAIGVVGDAYVGGEMLARGYLHAPSLTAARFVPDPLAKRPGARVYRTGDRMRWRPDGGLEFVGRADRQLKICGVRIEPNEIEAALRTHQDVGDVLVLPRSRKSGGQRLVAYIVPRGEHERSGKAWLRLFELRRHLRDRVPEAMVPAAFVLLDRWPLTAHGKIALAALPEPDDLRPELETPLVAARTPLEETLCAVLAEVLEVKPVGIHDDFFELGGDSLLAAQAIVRIKEHVAVTVPVRWFFDHPTIAALAEVIAHARVAHTDPAAVAEALADPAATPDSLVRRHPE